MSPLPNALLSGILWSALTIGLYAVSKRLHRRWPHPLLMPLALTPVMLGLLVLAVHSNYRDYIHGTGWLVALLGPCTVAFAVPIYEQRRLIRQQWPVLLIGTLVGSAMAMVSSWLLATLLGIDGALRLSLLPRSSSTPFAMQLSSQIGGTPELTAVFVVLTGILGAAIGEFVLARLPARAAIARGASFGMSAHGAGTARAYQIGPEEGAVAGLVMVLVGLSNVLAAPLISHLLHADARKQPSCLI